MSHGLEWLRAHVIGMEKGEERSFLCCSYGMLYRRIDP
jgi:hypothetical protein